MLIFLWAVARFDFSWHDAEYHQETLENLKAAIKSTKKLCSVCLFDVPKKNNLMVLMMIILKLNYRLFIYLYFFLP